MGWESIKQGIKNATESTKQAVKHQLAERERRLSTPEFKASMAKEKLAFKQSLQKTGNSAFRAGNSLVTKTILKPFEASAKAIVGKNKVEDASNAFFVALKGIGTTGVDTAKLILAVAEATGRLGKIAVRYAIAK